MSFTLTSWMELFLRLGLGALGVFGAVVLVARFSRSGTWLRTLWRSAFVAWLLLLGAEVTGVGGLLWQSLAARNPRRVVPTLQTSGLAGATKAPADFSEMTYRILPWEPQGLSGGTWWPGILWALISAILMWRSALTRIWLMWRERGRSEVTDPIVLGQARRVAGILGLTRVRWKQSATLVSPIAFGLVRPTVCLPRSFASDFTTEQQEAILAHELAHLAGRDPIWYALAELVCALWWWNPLVWVGRRQVFAASESAADEAVLRLGQGPGVLAECLVLLGRRLVEAGSPAMMGMGGTGLRSALAHRVTRLLELEGKPFPQVSWLQRWFLRPLVVVVMVSVGIISLGSQMSSFGNGTLNRAGWNSSLLRQTWAALSPRIAHPPLLDPRDTSRDPGEAPALFAPINDTDTTRWIEDLHWPKQAHQQTNFFTRTFQISSNEFSRLRNHPLFQELPGDVPLTSRAPLRNSDSETQALVLIRGFARAGFVIHPPKQLFYNARNGLLMIRAELRDLELVERLFVSALSTPQTQIVIQAKFIHLSHEDAEKQGVYRRIGLEPTRPPEALISYDLSSVGSLVDEDDPRADESALATALSKMPHALLSVAEAAELLEHLALSSRVQVLSCPTVVTLPGRHVQIEVVEPPVSGYLGGVASAVPEASLRAPPSVGRTNKQSQLLRTAGMTLRVGPRLQIIPRLSERRNEVNLRLLASFTEFLGDETGVELAPGSGKPRPVFQSRHVRRSASVRDGQTLAFCLGSDAPLLEQVALQNPTVSTKRGNLVVFVLVTATFVDAAGNRLNPE